MVENELFRIFAEIAKNKHKIHFMKFKSFIFTAVAAVMAFAACQKEPALDTSKLELSQTTMTFEKDGGSQTLTITSGRTWQAKFAESVEWVTVTPKTGSASADPQTITVTVLPTAVLSMRQ